MHKETSTYFELFKDHKVTMNKFDLLLQKWKTGKGNGKGKKIIQNLQDDWIVQKTALFSILFFLYKNCKSYTGWTHEVESYYQLLCNKIIDRYLLNSEDYSRPLSINFDGKIVGRCMTFHSFESSIARENKASSLGLRNKVLNKLKLQAAAFQPNEKHLKFTMGRADAPTWITFCGTGETCLDPFDFATQPFRLQKARAGLGLYIADIDKPQFLFKYQLGCGESPRFPTVVDANTYDYFAPVKNTQSPEHGHTDLIPTDIIHREIMRTDEYKRLFTLKIEPGLNDINNNSNFGQKEKKNEIASLKNKVRNKILDNIDLQIRPEAVYFGNQQHEINELGSVVGWEYFKPRKN